MDTSVPDGEAPSVSLAPRGPAEPAGGHTIQIIEDDAPLAAALAAGLETHGFRVLHAASATAGWEQAQKHRPDLILCDINMPGKNGYRLLQELRADPQLAACQFVFMTGNSTYAHPRTGMELGADDFLLKPFSLDTLVSCITARLHRADATRHGEDRLLRELRASLRAILPHEFFTPLTGIIGFAELLEEEMASIDRAKARVIVRDILRSGQRLHRTLRNYLAVLGLDSEKSAALVRRLPAAHVTDLINRGAHLAASRYGRGADLILRTAGAPLTGAPSDLTMLVEELTDNAFNFSTEGTSVCVRTLSTDGQLWLTVSDSGRGMTPQQLMLLGTFRQFDRKEFEQQGLGLGLSVAQKAVRRMGGELRLSSSPGRGTTCTVILPIDTRDEQPTARREEDDSA
jgi:signal transduction histidine kinase